MRAALIQFMLPILLGITVAPNRPAVQGPLVHLVSGSVAGKFQGDIAVFEGIPFAAAPVGDLRWREPQPVAPWSGVRDATKLAASCVQPSTGLDAFIGPLAAAYDAPYEMQTIKTSEDCLYLNVFSPGRPRRTGLPVMVWLHGGGNKTGSGGDETYDGTSLASYGVIVVTVNYRLGVMGFFSHPQLTAESPHHSSGNYGLLDQIAGLKWVQQNIAQFGGNPGNVTLFGESAGSIDATTLMASPLTKDLFRRVIAESGPAFGLGPEQTLAQAQAVGAAVGRQLGLDAHDVKALRQLSAAEVTKLDALIVASQFKGFDPSASVVDGWLLSQAPAKAFASGNIQRVDLLAGLNARELSAFRVGASAAAKRSGKPPEKGAVGAAIKQLANTARPLYGSWTDVAVSMYSAQILLHGDRAVDQASNDILMACPIGAEAALDTSYGQRAFIYLYLFSRSIPGKGEPTLGSFHGLEVPYVFNTFTVRTWRWLPFAPADHRLSATIESYWTNFAKTGDPNSPGLPTWKSWISGEEPYLEFNRSGEAVPRKNFSPPLCYLSPDRLRRQLAAAVN